MAILAGSLDGHLGAPSRHVRTVLTAGVILTVIWLLRSSSLFRKQYESGFSVVNPSKPPSPVAPVVNGPVPAALPGDDFYIVDALHHALNPPPPPPPPPEEAPPPREFPDNVAVLTETDVTRVPNLVPLVLHFANLLGPKWPVVVLTLKSTWVEPPSPAFRRLMAEQRVRIRFLPEEEDTTTTTNTDNTAAPLPPAHDPAFLPTRPWFWEQFASADRALLFRPDAVLCAKAARRVEDFAEWDLVGAPIAPPDEGVGFHGGLSLRNPKLALEVTRDAGVNTFEANLRAWRQETSQQQQQQREEKEKEKEKREGEGEGQGEGKEEKKKPMQPWELSEDQWFYHVLTTHRPEAKLPPPDVARLFAIGGGGGGGGDASTWLDAPLPLGYLAPYRGPAMKDAALRGKVLEYCPEVAMLRDGGAD